MTDRLDIKGGATEFEAAVIAAVVDRVVEEERILREGPAGRRRLSAWVRAARTKETGMVEDGPRPDRR